MMGISIDQDKLVDLFLQLVRINATSRQEKPVVDFLKQRLTALGVSVYEDHAGAQIGGNAGNLLVSLNGDRPAELFLCAHTDTVRPTEHLKPHITDGVIRSDGTTILGADNRAGVAILLYLIETIAGGNVRHRPFEVAFTVAEEIGLLGAANLEWNKLQAPSGYVFDSSLPPGNYISVTPTAVELHIRVFGKPAHAGVAPEKGVNAVSMAAEMLTRFPVGRVDEQTVANIGVIQGGEATNVVPGQVEMRGEIRSFSEATIERLLQQLDADLQAISQKYGGSYELHHRLHFQGFKIPEDHFITRHLKSKMAEVGLTPAGQVYHGGSDANVFNARGRTAINLGIGARNPHGNDEHIAIGDLVKMTQLALALVEAA